MLSKTKILYITSCWRIAIAAFLFISTAAELISQDGLVCNTVIQISLQDNCEALVVADHILEDPDPYLAYELKLTDPKGRTIKNNILTIDHVAKEIVAQVTNPEGVKCWGKIFVDSKIFPGLNGCHDITVSCSAYPDTLYSMPHPEMVGALCGEYSMTYVDDIKEFSCPEDKFSHVVNRVWTMHNISNYAYSCTQRIFVKQEGLANIYFPPNYNGIERPAISCDFELIKKYSENAHKEEHSVLDQIEFDKHGNEIIKEDHKESDHPKEHVNEKVEHTGEHYADSIVIVRKNKMQFLDSGFPSTKPFPYGTGAPGGKFCPNIKLNFVDTQFPVCGNESKILRRWHIVDWCTGEDLVRDQIIKLEDDEGPILKCSKESYTFTISDDDCFATIDTVPFPIEIYDCSPTNYTIGYKLKDDSGDPYSNVIKEGISRNEDGTYRITGVPAGDIWMVYFVEDECGHVSTCHLDFKIKDKQRPTAVCEKSTIVTLSEGGHAELWANKFHHNSYDNCAIVKQEIKRLTDYCEEHQQDAEFGEAVTFCCYDQSDIAHEVVFRVYDAHGNFGDCYVEIKMQDKLKPVIHSCAKNITLHCKEDYTDVNVTGGHPEAYDNCHMDMEYSDDLKGMNACGYGDIFRTWKVSDSQGGWSTCIQHIKMVDEYPFSDHRIKWPRNKDLTSCHFNYDSTEETGEPELDIEDCENITFNYEDKIFYDSEDACVKILRSWAVIDWCLYDDAHSDYTHGYWSHTQQIKVKDDTSPVFTSGCDDVEILLQDGVCEGMASIDVIAEDACSSDLSYRFKIDLFDDGNYEGDLNGEGASLTHLFPAGQHRISYFAEDNCANEGVCEINVEVKNNHSINQICINQLSLSLGVNGEVELWASDFIKDVSYQCGDAGDFTYSFSENIDDKVKVITCDDFNAGNGVLYQGEFSIYTIAGNGLTSSCQVSVKVTDNFNSCPDQEGSSALIAGKIINDTGIGIEGVMVYLNDMVQDDMKSKPSDYDGSYVFEELNYLLDYEITGKGNDDILEGLSTIDLIKLQQHILGINPLDSPYRLIAGDVDRSGNITALDLIHLRKLILGIENTFPSEDHWVFIDSDYEFTDPENIELYPQVLYLNQLDRHAVDMNLIGVKIGDVDNSYFANENRSLRTEEIVASTETLSNSLIKVNFKLSSKIGFSGIQFGLKFAKNKMSIKSINYIDNKLMDQSKYLIDDGNFSIVLTGMDLSDSNVGLFSVTFSVDETTGPIEDHIHFYNDRLTNEIYDKDLEVIRLNTSWLDKKEGFSLSSNSPNPFNKITSVPIEVYEDDLIKLELFDLSGRIIYDRSQFIKKGKHIIPIDLSHLNYSGIIVCKISNSYTNQTLKFVKSNSNN